MRVRQTREYLISLDILLILTMAFFFLWQFPIVQIIGLLVFACFAMWGLGLWIERLFDCVSK
jgi:hypothetical protein